MLEEILPTDYKIGVFDIVIVELPTWHARGIWEFSGLQKQAFPF